MISGWWGNFNVVDEAEVDDVVPKFGIENGGEDLFNFGFRDHDWDTKEPSTKGGLVLLKLIKEAI